jgi:hypothetical protein
VACASATLRQPAPSPVLPWPGTPLPNFPVRASAADAFTGVLLTDFAAARQFIPCQALLSLWATRETIPMKPPDVYSSHYRFCDVRGRGNLPRILWEASSPVRIQPSLPS